MKRLRGLKMASFLVAISAFGSGSAHAAALTTPALTGPLVANPNPFTLDGGDFGNIYVTGAVSGLAMAQSNSSQAPGDTQTLIDFTNAQISVQKTEGFFQFYVQAGQYATPSLGLPYQRATTASTAFGAIPVAYAKIAPTDNFSIVAGKLPTLIGAEYTFSFQNINIARGLLWNQEPAISRGVQANYILGPVTFSLSLNDGAYTNKYNQLSGLLAYAVSSTDTISAVGSGVLGAVSNPLAPVASQSVYNLIWTHLDGPWLITPYIQYTEVPTIGAFPSTSSWSGAVLTNYAFDSNWSLGARAEYIAQDGGFDPMLYGHDSSAFSITVTPTYQYKVFFARADISYVKADAPSFFSSQGFPGPGFGRSGANTDQERLMLEVGILF
jgi:hypothetical protein